MLDSSRFLLVAVILAKIGIIFVYNDAGKFDFFFFQLLKIVICTRFLNYYLVPIIKELFWVVIIIIFFSVVYYCLVVRRIDVLRT